MDFPPAFNLLTQFGCSFVLLRSFYRSFNILGLCLILASCFKVLRFIWRFKTVVRFLCDSGGLPKIRLCFKNIRRESPNSKTKPLTKSLRPGTGSSFRKRPNGEKEKGNGGSEDGSDGKVENENEDEVFDVVSLRRIAKMERLKANAASAELEKERTAASSSAEEAMAMIHRLQSEKSTAEIQATQFRRMAEQKLDYDQEMIESLQWTISQHEFQKCDLEDQLGICKEELKQFIGDDEIEQIESEASRGYMYDDDDDRDRDDGNAVVSSPEIESHRHTL